MSRWGSAFRLIATAVVLTLIPGGWAAGWQYFAAQAESERQRRKRDKANARARAAFNDAQKDRLQMLDLVPDMARTLCLGRVRYVEGVRRRWSSGTHDEKLTMIVSFAGHEIDGFEQWYVDDLPVTLDGSGWVQQAPFGSTVDEPSGDYGTLNGSGGATIVLTYTPIGGSVSATWSRGAGDNYESGLCTVDSVIGTTVTLSGGAANAAVAVNYLRVLTSSFLRIRPYLGTDAQNVGSAIVGEYPGKITATDRFAGIALAVVDLVFSPDVFPQGPPNITAVLRGAKCYDPRKDSTVAGGSGAHRIATPSTWEFSENPALHALRYAIWSAGFRLPTISARTLADVMAAADRCDISTAFTLRKPDTSTEVVNLVRHRGGLTIAADADKRQIMDTIVDAMAGEWAFDGPHLRLRAGMMGSSVASMDQTWLVQAVQPGGEAEGDPVINASQAISREQRFNRITGACVDQNQRYQLLPYPAVSDATLISAKGEKRTEVDYPAVSHIAHAQHLASIEIRRAQAGTIMQMTCDPRAEMLELFDIVTLTIPDYGITAKTMEVVGTDLAVSGGGVVGLMAREITAAIYSVDAELGGRDPAPDSSLRAPWDVGDLGPLTVTSGTIEQTDGSVLTRTTITWGAVTGDWIRNGGDIEIQYARADETLPAGDWATWSEPGNSTRAIIPGLMAGRPYIFRGRLVQRLPLVRGPWGPVAAHALQTVRGTLIRLVTHGAEAARLIVSGNSVERSPGGVIDWNAGAHSAAPVIAGCRLSFTIPQANKEIFAGLNTDPTTDAGFASLDYAMYFSGAGAFDIRESNLSKGASISTYAAGARCVIEYDGAAVRYIVNGVVVRQVGAPPGLALWFDSSLSSSGARIDELLLSGLSSVQRGNMLDSGSWITGAGGSQGVRGGNYFEEAAPAGTNTIGLRTTPDQALRPAWVGDSTGTSTYQGWESPAAAAIPILPSMTVRWSLWVRHDVIGATPGSFYLGPSYLASAIADIPTGNVNGNPYFLGVARGQFVAGRWYLHVGFVFPSGSGTTQNNKGGVYDGATGQKILNATDFKWRADASVTGHRAFTTGATSGDRTLLWQPRVELCDGSEPSVDQLMAAALLTVGQFGPLDWAQSVGLNGQFTLWSGTYPDGWTLYAGSANIAKEATLFRSGPNAVRMTPPGGAAVGIYFAHTFSVLPQAGSYLRVSCDMRIVTNTAGAQPGVLVILYTNVGLTTDRRVWLTPPALTTGVWQTVAANVAVRSGESIYAAHIYLIGSDSSAPGGHWQGDVVFDSLLIDLMRPTDTDHLSLLSASEVLAPNVAPGTYPKSSSSARKLLGGIVLTAGGAFTAEVTVVADATASGSVGSEWGGSWLGVACDLTSNLTDNGDSTYTPIDNGGWNSGAVVKGLNGAATARATYTLTARFDLTPGVEYRIGCAIKGANPDFGITFTMNIEAAPTTNVTIIKR